jgi:hypothetical protein
MGAADGVVSCPWPWQTPVCPPECYCEFYGGYYEDDEVYVLRLDVMGIDAIEEASQAILFARALGESFMVTDPCDVRGVAFDKTSTGRFTVEIPYSTDDAGVSVAQHTEAGLGEKIAENGSLRAEFPNFQVVSARRLRLLDEAAVKYWLSAAIVWSASHGSTIAYDRAENVWTGSAAQRQKALQSKEPLPVGPPPGSNEGVGLSTETMVGLALVGVVLLLAFRARRRKASR